MKKHWSILLLIITICNSCAQRTEAEKFADELISKMTIREKVGQMSQFVTNTGVVTGPDGEKMDIDQLVKAGEVGSILNITTPEEIERMQRLAVDSTRLGIPILFGHDIIHGCKVIFPINLACACTWDTESVKESAHHHHRVTYASCRKTDCFNQPEHR